MTTMVPQLVGFFKDMQGTLPPATRFLIAANQFFSSYWWLMIGGAVAAYAGFQTLIQTAGGRAWWHRVSWGLPVLSIIPQHRFYAQFARTLSTLTENGVTMLRALELLEDAAGNDYIRDKMREVRAAVVDGATLSAALHARKIFPDLFVDMMAVGEQTGKFSETMSMIADVYERELDKQVQVVSTLIPPLVMVMVAVVIGSVVYGVLSAVFNLTSSLHHVRR
jgi:type II secretory pathway component PulF